MRRDVRIAVIGGGFGGIAASYHLKKAGLDNFTVFEKSDAPGGVWNGNRCPGIEVDAPSHLYCFTFNTNDWSHRYASQKALKRYLEKTVDEFGLRAHFRFNTGVVSVVWSDADKRFSVGFSDGRNAEFDAVISCVGSLSTPLIPAGMDAAAFPGTVFHTSRWPDEVALEGRRVGVIGTGASAAQAVVEAAKVASSVTVFQRSPNWVLPKRNKAFTAAQRARYGKTWQYRYKLFKELLRYERTRVFTGPDIERSSANRFRRDVAADHLARSLAGRPDLVQKLTPDHAYGAKRTVASDDYYQALCRKHVSLAPAAARLDPGGVLDEQGERHDLDVVVLATGFRAADYLSQLKVTGRNGVDLHEEWKGEPAAFLGSCVPGFPNFFMINGPNSVSGAQVFMLECQARFVAGCIAAMVRRGGKTVEVRRPAFDRFNRRLQARLETSVYKTARNYYASPSGRIVTQWPFPVTRFWWISRTARRFSMTID